MLKCLSRPSRPWLAIPALVFATLLALPAQARTLATAYGPVELQGSPQRVVALGDNALDAVVSLGIEPVGSLASRGGTDIPAYLKAHTGKIAVVGTTREPNLEAILALQPDLIVASTQLDKALYDKLSMMAPTLVPAGDSFDDWRETFAFYAQALDKADQGKARVAEIDSRIAALKPRLPQGVSVSVVRWNPQGPGIMSSHLFVGQLLSQLGFKPVELAESLTDRPHSDILSLENLSKVDADWLFLATLNPEGDQALAQARQQPAFTRLKAVSNKQVVSVDGQIWSSSAGYLAASQVLDDVEKAMAE